MILRPTISLGIVLFFFTMFCSCRKFLEEKPLKSLAVPSSLADLQALLDNSNLMNTRNVELAELIADNYYVNTDRYLSASVNDRANYNWDKDANSLAAWKLNYQYPVYYANVVLDYLERIPFPSGNGDAYNQVKGAALFFRSFAFWQLAQLYCSPYAAANANEPGIPVRSSSGITEPSVRVSVQATYNQIITDLKAAALLLPLNAGMTTRPDKAAAFAALARTFLSMRDYTNAGLYADSCLQLRNELMDYNNLVPVGSPAISRFNRETLFYAASIGTFRIVYPAAGRVDSLLYRSYDDKDLRKTLFFMRNTDGSYAFRGSYDGDSWEAAVFNGLAVDEVLLIRSESYARNGNTSAAMRDLNLLMEKRWFNDGSFVPFTASDTQEALSIILRERRKELLYRGLRWTDLRRLNLEGQQITLTRVIDNITYQLPPEDPRWVLLIPQEVIQLSGMLQNKR